MEERVEPGISRFGSGMSIHMDKPYIGFKILLLLSYFFCPLILLLQTYNQLLLNWYSNRKYHFFFFQFSQLTPLPSPPFSLFFFLHCFSEQYLFFWVFIYFVDDDSWLDTGSTISMLNWHNTLTYKLSDLTHIRISVIQLTMLSSLLDTNLSYY